MSEPESSDAAPAPEPAAPAPEPAAPDPQTQQLGGAVAHFMGGNFAAARRALGELKRGELRPEIATQADELLRRMGLDPVALWIAIGSAVLFLVVVVLTFRG